MTTVLIFIAAFMVGSVVMRLLVTEPAERHQRSRTSR